MSDEQRIDPIKELNKLKNTVGKVLEQGINTVQSTVQSAVQNATASNPAIRVDVYEFEDNIVIKTSAIDGLIPDSIEVSMEGDILTIRVDTKAEDAPEGASFILQERKYGTLEREVVIPLPVFSEEAKAKLNKAKTALTITLPIDRVTQEATMPSDE